jgi:hypothetical protein
MDYKEALGRWGANKAGLDPELWTSIRVDLDVDPGYSSPYNDGGYDSYAESPSVNIEVIHKMKVVYYDNITYDFTTVVQEILEVADGKH